MALTGFSAVAGQIVLMRELIQVFNGNEIALGILLATWLLWTAAGSGLCALFAGKLSGENRARFAVAALECLLAASLPATIWALRNARTFFRLLPGELAGPGQMLIASFVCLSVFCAVSGALFVAATRMFEGELGVSARAAAGSAYLLEAAGSALGGIAASIVLVRFLGAFQIALLLALLNVWMAVVLLLKLKRRKMAWAGGAAALAAIPLLAVVAPRWDAASRAQLWTGFDVLASRDSIYGNLTVTETPALPDPIAGSIRSLYENGAVLANAPDPAAAEESVHYALLEHATPRRVLLIGGGVAGGVAEALKHPSVERLDYVELDPALIAIARQWFPAQAAAFADPRVRLHPMDGRRFLFQSRETYDVIIVDVPDPQTAQLNRFYTVEFCHAARARLKPGGLLALQLRSSEETIGPQLAEFLRSIRRTLGEVFPYQAMIPGETLHLFGAMKPATLTEDPSVLIARLRERHLATQYVREYFLPYRMSADRMAQAETELRPAASTPVNRDFAPVAYAFDVVLWSGQFRSGYAERFGAAAHAPFANVAAAIAVALVIGVVAIAFLPGTRRERAAAASCVAATGFTLMALEIFLLLGFQAVYGYVYTELAVLTGLFMAGIAAGSWLALRHAEEKGLVSEQDFRRAADTTTHAGALEAAEKLNLRKSVKGTGFSPYIKCNEIHGALAPEGSFRRFPLVIMQLLLSAAPPLLLLIVALAGNFSRATAALVAAQFLFPALAALAGILGGIEFVFAAQVFVRERDRSGLGTLYAIDLAGGCAGALALSGFLIPLFGFWRTAWLVAGINLTATVLAFAARTRTKKKVE